MLRRGAILLAAVGVAVTAQGHPGGRDKDGCHVCRKNCERFELKAGEKHCHGGAKGGQADGAVFEFAWVDKVLDGDTLKVRVGGEKLTVRVLGIDCPESKRNRKCRADKDGCAWQIPWGMRAAKRAAQLLKHKQVTLECDGKCSEGRYDRALRYIRLPDGRDFGRVMIEEAFCSDYGWKYPHARGKEYERAQAPVKASFLGMWQEHRW